MRFRTSTSMINLTEKAIEASQPIKHLVIKATDFSTYFSIFLANSKGKDKTIALFQYLFDFICLCGKHSNIDHIPQLYKKSTCLLIQQEQLLDMKIYYGLKQSISQARKVFRLFRYFDQIKGLVKILKTDKPIAFKILSVFTYFCSIMYYIADNTLWATNIVVKSGGLDKTVTKYWKYKKNFFSLCRVIAYTIILIYSVILQKKQLKEKTQILQKLLQKSTHSLPHSHSHAHTHNKNHHHLHTHLHKQHHLNHHQSSDLLEDQREKLSQKYYSQKLLQSRRKQRFLYLEMALSFCRIQMLIKSLKLSGHQWLDPIYVGGLGVCSSILNFLKALFEKKIIVSLDKKQQNIFDNYTTEKSKQKPTSSKFW